MKNSKERILKQIKGMVFYNPHINKKKEPTTVGIYSQIMVFLSLSYLRRLRKEESKFQASLDNVARLLS
jgi:hypothetical protein